MRVIERIIVCFHPFAPRTLDLSTKYALHVIDHIPLPPSLHPFQAPHSRKHHAFIPIRATGYGMYI